MNLQSKPKKLKTWLLIAATIGSLLLPSTARSEDQVGVCVQKCDAALKDQDRVINLKTREIAVHKDIIAAQDVRIGALEKEKGGLFRSPWFYFGLGVVAGAVLMRR